MPSQTHLKRFDHLDGLRAIAALSVVLQHTVELSFINGPAGGWIAALFGPGFNFGRYGVVVFFLISGFLIPSSIRPAPGALRDFAISRFFRLYPLYWLSIAAAVVLLPLIRDQHFPPSVVIANISMFQMAFGIPNVIELYWTLFVELIFYFASAALFAMTLLHRSWLPMVMVTGLGLVICAASLVDLRAASGGAMKVATFAMYLQTMYLGQALRKSFDMDARTPAWAIGITVMSVLFYCLTRQLSGHFLPGLTPLGVFTSTTAAVLTFLLARRIPGIRTRTMVYLGALSYGIYLFHPIVSAAVRQALSNGRDWLELAMVVTSVVSITIVVSALGHHFIEQPAISQGKKFRSLRKVDVVPNGAATQSDAS